MSEFVAPKGLALVTGPVEAGGAGGGAISPSDGLTNILWLQGASCGGCTMSILESGASGWFDELRQFGIE